MRKITVGLVFFFISCFFVSSQEHLSLQLELVENQQCVPHLNVKLKNISEEQIHLSNNSVHEIKKVGRLIIGDNTVCCFKNVGKAGKLFYGGSFIMDRKKETITIDPGEEITFQTKVVGPGMPFDGAISFYNEEAKDFSKVSCYIENIVYSTNDGRTTPRFTMESNSIDITDLNIYDEDFMNISLSQNGELYHYVLLINGTLIPRQAEDFNVIYNKILKKRGFQPIEFQTTTEDMPIQYTSGTVTIPESFLESRISPDELADLYIYCIMSAKYKQGNKPYKMNELGQIQSVGEKLPRIYINHLVAALQDALSIDGTYYKLSPDKRQNITGSISYWKNQLAQSNCY